MTHRKARWTVAIAVIAWTASAAAHHSIAMFDTTTPVWVKGTIVRFDLVNPHARIYLDQAMENGQVQRWVVDGGPALFQLERRGVTKDTLKTGDVIEVCGFLLRESVQPPQSLVGATSPKPDASSPTLAGRVLHAHVLVMPDGARRFWSDYGHLDKCLRPGETRSSLVG